MLSHWNLPLTYQQKIRPVKSGDCTQTIRVCNVSKSKKRPGELIKKSVGDLIRFYIWDKLPYRSHRKTITKYMPLIEVSTIRIFPDGISFMDPQKGSVFIPWTGLDYLAKRDGIYPPTGAKLGEVLKSKNKIPSDGVEAQILRREYV